jgi:hypothetical protein
VGSAAFPDEVFKESSAGKAVVAIRDTYDPCASRIDVKMTLRRIRLRPIVKGELRRIPKF